MRPKVRTVEQELARIASAAHGIVTHAELIAAGITPAEIKSRVAHGAILREHRGIYRVGHRAPSLEARYMAAVKAGGEGAVASGKAAGHLLKLLKGAPPPPEVTVPKERRIRGVEVHRDRHLDPRHTTIVRGIPTTSVARTLVDLAAVLSEEELARACHEAHVLHRLRPEHVEGVLERRPTARGAGTLRAILHGRAPVTLSALERRFLQGLRRAALPPPETNKRVDGRYVDCRWPAQRLTVELDSYRYHATRHAWEQDRKREREARMRGDEFRRYSYSDVFEDPSYMLTDLAGLIAR